MDRRSSRRFEVTTAVVTRDPVAAPTVMIAETRPVVNAEAEADEAKEVVEAVESRSLLIML